MQTLAPRCGTSGLGEGTRHLLLCFPAARGNSQDDSSGGDKPLVPLAAQALLEAGFHRRGLLPQRH